MANDTILVPVKKNLEGKEFYDNKTDKALKTCQTEGFEAVFMPSIADTRIEAPKDARIWQTWYSAPSVKATGKTKQGNAVVVYAHIPNYFSNPNNIETAISQGLINGAGIMPQDELQRLLDLADNENVFVLVGKDYDKLKNSSSGVIPLKNALKHPQTIPFLGGKERAERYLERHKEVYGNQIGNWHLDDLSEKPLGRLLCVGNDYYNGLNGDNFIFDNGRFIGVRGAEGAMQKIIPSQEQLTAIIGDYVAPINRNEVTERISALYK